MNSPVTGEFPAQKVNNAENVSIWWRHPDSIDAFRPKADSTMDVAILIYHYFLKTDFTRFRYNISPKIVHVRG